jgi:hypothetical protein
MDAHIKWCFYDPESKTKSADLSTDEAQMTILQMRPKDIDRLYFIRTGTSNWRPLRQLVASDASPFAGLTLLAAAEAGKEKIKMQQVDPNTQDDIERTFTSSNIDYNRTLAADFEKPKKRKIELVLMNKKGNIYRVDAHDADPRGVVTSKPLPPDFENITFDMVVIGPKSKTKVSGKLIADSQRHKIEFIFRTENERSSLIESLNCEN